MDRDRSELLGGTRSGDRASPWSQRGRGRFKEAGSSYHSNRHAGIGAWVGDYGAVLGGFSPHGLGEVYAAAHADAVRRREQTDEKQNTVFYRGTDCGDAAEPAAALQ